MLADFIPADWRSVLQPVIASAAFAELEVFITAERVADPLGILPREEDVFRALKLTPFESVRVVILGQDPYPTPGHADGLAFSVPRGTHPLPGTLRNILRRVADDTGEPAPPDGCLEGWAEQGVLLLNTILTVNAGAPMSHARRGWETVTAAVLSSLASKDLPALAILWGARARAHAAQAALAPDPRLTSSHPSQRSAWRGFNSTRPFTVVNQILRERGDAPVNWSR